MSASASTLDRFLSILLNVVRQHATQRCARTAITTATTLVRKRKTGLHFALGSVSAPHRPQPAALANSE